MSVAVIILNWNGSALLREYLPSVVANTPGGLASVIVADNGSTDDSLALLRAEFPTVKVIPFAENYGFAEGYNRAIDATPDADMIVLLNSDVAVGPHWLEPLVEFMDTHPEAAACQPKILSLRRPGYFEYAGAAGGFLDCNGYPYCRGRVLSDVEADHGQYDDDIPVHWASGACLLVRRADYIAAGGLDPAFFAHMEEIDLCWRLRSMGREVWAVGSSSIGHLGGATLDAGNPRKTYLNFRNNLLMMQRNLPEKGRRRKLITRRLLDTLPFLAYVAQGRWRHARAILKAHADYRRLAPSLTPAPAHSPLPPAPNLLLNMLLRRKASAAARR